MSDYGRMPNFDTYGFGWPGGPDYEPPPPPKCISCGAFLPLTPDSTEPWENALECDGSEQIVEMEYEGSTLVILDLPAGSTYKMSVSPCGVEVGKHEPHTEVLDGGIVSKTTCRKCGALTATV